MKSIATQNIENSFLTSTKKTESHHLNEDIPRAFTNGLDTDFNQEVKDYLYRFPQTKHIDIYLNDINGTFRGKRISINDLYDTSKGYYFPESVYSMDWKGKVHTTENEQCAEDEPDRLCLPVKGTLRPSVYDPESNAQLLLSMRDVEGKPFQNEPRVILDNILQKFHHHGLYPVMAPEIEFYLTGMDLHEINDQGCYQMLYPVNYTHFIEKLERVALEQNLLLTGIVCEAEPGQFELNLQHSDDVLKVCEHVLALRRLTSIVAQEFGYKANFMAKPFSLLAGNGLHFHVSIIDTEGNNIYSSPCNEFNEMLRMSLAGLLELMPPSMAIMAPCVNSFRRIRKNLHEPLFSSWGYNTRSVALRIPCSNEESRRIEYRLAGSDANPYLVAATILAGILYGLEKLESTALNNQLDNAPDLPLFQQQAIDTFLNCDYLTEILGKNFSKKWAFHKLEELTQFERIVTKEESDVNII